MYSRAKCSTIERVMAYTRTILSHRGRVKRDSLEERAFIALNISITTKLRFLLATPKASEGVFSGLTSRATWSKRTLPYHWRTCDNRFPGIAKSIGGSVTRDLLSANLCLHGFYDKDVPVAKT